MHTANHNQVHLLFGNHALCHFRHFCRFHTPRRGDRQSGTAECQRQVVNLVPLISQAIFGGVLAYRRQQGAQPALSGVPIAARVPGQHCAEAGNCYLFS